MTAQQTQDQDPDALLPPDSLCGDSGSISYWLDAAWTFEDIRDEYDWLFEDRSVEESLTAIWLRPRLTTEAERADPDALYELFGDGWEDMDTAVYYEQAAPESAGAHKYWTVD